MKYLILTNLFLFSIGLAVGQDWASIKEAVSPTIELTSEFDSIYSQPLSGLGWEDGVHISADGLNLYCTYVPIDLLSFSLNGDLPDNFSVDYLRGSPDFGMDLITNPIGASEWLHSDILYSHRNTLTDPFESWQLSNMSRPFYSEGAPTPSIESDPNSVEFMMFTSNDNSSNNVDIWVIQNTMSNPTGIGAAMPSPITTSWNEDNPHLVRLSEDELVLFYDSDNLPGGLGDIDLWYSISIDNGTSWSNPSNLSSINTSSKEHQPFLFFDHTKQNFYLYYSAVHTDGKLAIFRREQLIEDDWDSWGSADLIISAGNSAGIGEPTLTENGDLSFVVVYEDPDLNSIYNRFDSDPWFLRKKESVLNITNSQKDDVGLLVYPNPSGNELHINPQIDVQDIRIFDIRGILCYHGIDKMINTRHFLSGIYYVKIYTSSGNHLHGTFMKN